MVDAEPIQEITSHLKERFALDLDQYKLQMILRRIERRVNLSGMQSLEAYASYLKRDDAEANRLYHDMLIGVTGFFRDHDVFERLEHDVIPTLLNRLRPQDEFRCWVAGVATGEEAYSLAMLLAEAIESRGVEIRARIFASDIHDASLYLAGKGIYPVERLEGVSVSRRERFFIERQDGFHIGPELRRMVVFTPHNVLRDPPFTRLDLISCRNLLIYFNPKAQQKVLSLFHFGLKTNGVLCLGQSESLGELRNEFQVIDDGSRIYRKYRGISAVASISSIVGSAAAWPRKTQADPSQKQLAKLYDHLLNQFFEPAILLNSRREVQHVFGDAGRFLFFPNGRPVNDILDIIHSDLRTAVTIALGQVTRAHKSVPISARVQLNSNELHAVSVLAESFSLGDESDPRILLRLLQDKNGNSVATDDEKSDEGVNLGRYRDLENELQHTRENLQATIEQLQFVNEQLQAANEELTASNQELQSTNEELHSVNEELYTVNAEHQRKIDELMELNDDIDNLLSTSNVHTLFVDTEMRLRRFTPAWRRFLT